MKRKIGALLHIDWSWKPVEEQRALSIDSAYKVSQTLIVASFAVFLWGNENRYIRNVSNRNRLVESIVWLRL